MTDFFALFDEERRPWLDADALKEKYHALTARHHPDVAEAGGDADFAEINRAYQTLVEPAARLRHLLELEAPEALLRTQGVPEDVAVFFAPVAEARQGVDGFFRKLAGASSPLAKALLSAEQYQVQERVEEMIGALQGKEEELLGRVRGIDALWEEGREAALRALPGIWQSLGYIGKWLATLRESLFRLAAL
jgi:curved DNA-binding protein CbpA